MTYIHKNVRVKQILLYFNLEQLILEREVSIVLNFHCVLSTQAVIRRQKRGAGTEFTMNVHICLVFSSESVLND